MNQAQVTYIFNNSRESGDDHACPAFMSETELAGVRPFHRSFPQYQPTPLHSLDNLAALWGVKNIWVKDESYRFGLNAFKALGCSYAVGKCLGQRLQLNFAELNYARLRSREVRERLGNATFVTATAGNHGRGVAWAANQLSQKCVVYMPRGSSVTRLESIRREGAKVSIIDGTYEQAVRLAQEYAEQSENALLLQDTAWEGYEDIPTWIMQGYSTLIAEIMEQLQDQGQERITHLFLQVGVGSFSGAILGFLVAKYGAARPTTIIVEPKQAAWALESACSDDQSLHSSKGDLVTVMAGLACAEGSPLAWPILRDYANMFVSCPDSVTARGMRILASPLRGDPTVVSGESGACGLGLLSLIMERNDLQEMKHLLNLNTESKVLLISTEGDTDPFSYRKLVWDGRFPY